MATVDPTWPNSQRRSNQQLTSGAFFWLTAFYFVYCARPEDWIPGLFYVPLAKITGLFVVLGLFSAAGSTARKVKDLPREGHYFLALVLLLFASAAFSPVWKTGALWRTVNFGKAFIAFVLTYLLVTDFAKVRRIMFIQTASVAAVAVVSIAKGYSTPRLQGVLGGIYSNPNDLAFAIVLALPFCLAFCVTAKTGVRKVAWLLAMLAMLAAIFLTASRAGFIDLVFAGAVCLWNFGIKGRRPFLIVSSLVLVILMLATVGGKLRDRFGALSGDTSDLDTRSAYGSYEARKYLMQRALEGIEHYPLLGIGANNFVTYSQVWHEVHMTYLQIAVEGGIPALILFILFFWRGFSNLATLRRRRDLDEETQLFVGALHSSYIGFLVGACFAPEAYQFFPYFAVAHIAALLAVVKEHSRMAEPTRRYAPALSGAAQSYAFD